MNVDGHTIPARLPEPHGTPARRSRWRPTWASSIGRIAARVAVVVTTDGRRVHMPIEPNGFADVSLLSLLRSLLGLDGLLGLITGSRRENGGTRRDER